MESLPLSFSIYVSKRQWQITRIFDSDHQMSSKYLRALFLGYFGLLPFIVKSQDSGSITMHFDYKDTILRLQNYSYDSIECQGYKVDSVIRHYNENGGHFVLRLKLNFSDFLASRFPNPVLFSRTTFYKDAKFFLVSFYDTANFSECDFKKQATFLGTNFFGYTSFYNTYFNGYSDFGNSKFGLIANFSAIRIGDSASFDFRQALLPDLIDFSENVNIPRIIDLSNANYSDPSRYHKNTGYYIKHLIRLRGSDVSKFTFDYHYFTLDTSRMSDDEKAGQYEALLKNFDQRGRKESYKLLDIEYQRFKHPNFAWINHWWWNYGYDRWYIILWIIAFTIVFTIITEIFYNALNSKVYSFDNMSDQIPWRQFGMRTWYSFLYTSAIFLRLTLRIENFNFKNKAGVVYIFLVYTVGIVCLGYLANWVLQK